MHQGTHKKSVWLGLPPRSTRQVFHCIYITTKKAKKGSGLHNITIIQAALRLIFNLNKNTSKQSIVPGAGGGRLTTTEEQEATNFRELALLILPPALSKRTHLTPLSALAQACAHTHVPPRSGQDVIQPGPLHSTARAPKHLRRGAVEAQEAQPTTLAFEQQLPRPFSCMITAPQPESSRSLFPFPPARLSSLLLTSAL